MIDRQGDWNREGKKYLTIFDSQNLKSFISKTPTEEETLNQNQESQMYCMANKYPYNLDQDQLSFGVVVDRK